MTAPVDWEARALAAEAALAQFRVDVAATARKAAEALRAAEADMVARDTVQLGSVIQLDPAHSPWGPLLAVVDEIHAWGVRCYALIPNQRGEAPGAMYMRVTNGRYAVTGGAAIWIPEDEADGTR